MGGGWGRNQYNFRTYHPILYLLFNWYWCLQIYLSLSQSGLSRWYTQCRNLGVLKTLHGVIVFTFWGVGQIELFRHALQSSPLFLVCGILHVIISTVYLFICRIICQSWIVTILICWMFVVVNIDCHKLCNVYSHYLCTLWKKNRVAFELDMGKTFLPWLIKGNCTQTIFCGILFN